MPLWFIYFFHVMFKVELNLAKNRLKFLVTRLPPRKLNFIALIFLALPNKLVSKSPELGKISIPFFPKLGFVLNFEVHTINEVTNTAAHTFQDSQILLLGTSGKIDHRSFILVHYKFLKFFIAGNHSIRVTLSFFRYKLYRLVSNDLLPFFLTNGQCVLLCPIN